MTGVVQAAVSPGDVSHAVGTMISVIWGGAFSAIGAVTFAFAGLQRTGAGARLLADWPAAVTRFARVMPKDYKRVLDAARRAQRDGLNVDEAVMAAAQG